MTGPYLSEVLRRAAADHCTTPAFVGPGESIVTYTELDQMADRAAAGLRAAGVDTGDVVALTLPSTVDYVATFLGAARLGAVTAGVNPGFTATETESCLATIEPTLIIDSTDAAQALRHHGDEPTPGIEAPADRHRPVCICFTSGSTGSPKAAWFTDRQLEAIAELDTGGAWGGGGHGIAPTQFAHVGFMTKLGWMLASGRTTHLLARWSAGPVLELISRYAMTSVPGVAPQIALMLRNRDFDSFDLTSVQAIVAGAAASPPDLVREARERFGAPYSIRYSSTESGGVGLGTALDANDDEALYTVGRPRPGVEIEIRTAAGSTVAPGEIGHLWLRSPAVMSGYWNDPEATAAVLVDGWLDTGDLAHIDDAGCVRLAGRAKEMFIRGGYNVYPMEVEAALGAHPDVVEVAVVPRPDPVMGEVGVAVVVANDPTNPPSLHALRAFGADHLAKYKLPEALRVVETLPRNANQKVDRRALSDLLLAGD